MTMFSGVTVTRRGCLSALLLGALLVGTAHMVHAFQTVGHCWDGSSSVPYVQRGTNEDPLKCDELFFCEPDFCWQYPGDNTWSHFTARTSIGLCYLGSSASDRCSLCQYDIVCATVRHHLTEADCNNNVNVQYNAVIFGGLSGENCIP